MKNEISSFYKLKNNQWLKIIFSYNGTENVWFETIVVADTKRKCNDCSRKTEKSPKVIYGQYTGKNLGVQALKIALDELLKFEKTLKYSTQINIIGASDRLNKVYKYLLRYGYKIHEYKKFNKDCTLLYKELNI